MEKKIYLVLVFCGLMMSIRGYAQDIIDGDIGMFKIGELLPNGIDINSSRMSLMVTPSTFRPFILLRSDRFIFVIASDDKNRIRFIGLVEALSGTNCSDFLTPEGIHIGMTYNDILNIFPDIKIVNIRGWAYIAKLPSGWKIAFTKELLRFPELTDRIDMIYKDEYN
jgi:hypothetical protein